MGLNWNGAFAAAGGAVAEVGAEMGKSAIREAAESRMLAQRGAQESSLMKERAAIEDMRLQRERDRMSKVGTEAEAARTGPAYDPATDSVRPQTPAEAAQAAAGVYNKNGMIAEAMRTREFEEQRAGRAEDRLDRRVDRTADNERADRQLTMTENHQKAMERMQAASNSRMAELAKVQLEAARFDLDTKKEIKTMQDKFAASTDPAERATLERNILTRLGKAKELPEPVKLYVDTVKSELTAIAKAEADGMPLSPESKARRAELQAQMASLATTGSLNIGAAGPAKVPEDSHITALQQRGTDSKAIAAFDAQYGAGAAKRYLNANKTGDAPAPRAAATPAPQRIPEDLQSEFNSAKALSEAMNTTTAEMSAAKGDPAQLLELNKKYAQQRSTFDEFKQKLAARGVKI